MEKALDVIARIPLFSGLSQTQLAQFQGIALEKNFAKGELIFSEGDEGNGFYIILAGKHRDLSEGLA